MNKKGPNNRTSFIWKDKQPITVNSEIFARILFSRNFAYAKLRENKNSSRIGYFTLYFIDIRESHPCRDFQSRKYVI